MTSSPTTSSCAKTAAYPAGTLPPWVARALDDVAGHLDGVQSLEREVQAVTREIARAEEHGNSAHEQLVRALEVTDADLATLKLDESVLQRRMKPLEEHAAIAQEALARTWAAAQTSMTGPQGPGSAAIDAMEQLGRDAARCREARAAVDQCAAEAAKHAAKRADVERQCEVLQHRLAEVDEETRLRLERLRERIGALGADIAAHHGAFVSQAAALERHLGAFPALNSLLPASETPTLES